MSIGLGYYCRDCESCFDKPEMCFERHGLDMPPYETLLVCPKCKSTDFISIIYCDCCGDMITDTYIHVDTGEDYCQNCYTHKEAI